MKKIYIAASRTLMQDAKAYAEVLKGLGFEIAYEWWTDVEEQGDDDTLVDSEVLFDCAVADSDGVLNCDVFWLLAPKEGGTGCWVELGIAIAKARMSWTPKRGDETDDYSTEPHIVVSGAEDRTLFTILNEVQECFETHDSALAFITRELAS